MLRLTQCWAQIRCTAQDLLTKEVVLLFVEDDDNTSCRLQHIQWQAQSIASSRDSSQSLMADTRQCLQFQHGPCTQPVNAMQCLAAVCDKGSATYSLRRVLLRCIAGQLQNLGHTM